MIHCFVTGVRLPIEQAFVLNRGEARRLLAALSDRAESLRRVIEQMAPLDDAQALAQMQCSRRPWEPRKKHRLVCKAVAEAMGLGFPEISLFIKWVEYQSQAQSSNLRRLRGSHRFADMIQGLDGATLQAAERLGRAVLGLIDPERRLPRRVRTAIAAATCALHRQLKAAEVVRLIREAALGVGDPARAGLDARELAAIREHLASTAAGTPVASSAQSGATP